MRFNFTLKYVPGTKMGKVDRLSRRLDWKVEIVSYVSPPVQKYIPVVKSPPNHTSLSSIAAIFLALCLMAVLQLYRYSVFYSGDTPI